MRTPSQLPFALLCITTALSACASAPRVVPGPGMTVHFNSGIQGKGIVITKAVTAQGGNFSNPGGLSYSATPLVGGKVMGGAPDSRTLPEWVEFSWIETVYPPTGPVTREALMALPVKLARVDVRKRVPVDVVNEIVNDKQRGGPGSPADLSLLVHFVWYASGVRFRWEERSGCCTVVRAGGDVID